MVHDNYLNYDDKNSSPLRLQHQWLAAIENQFESRKHSGSKLSPKMTPTAGDPRLHGATELARATQQSARKES